MARKKVEENKDTSGAGIRETSRKQLQARKAALREVSRTAAVSRGDYERLYEFAPTAYLTIDGQGAIRTFNQAAAALLGIERSNLAPMSFVSFVVPLERHKFLNHLFSCRKGNGVGSCSVNLRTADGTMVPAQVATRCTSAGKEGLTYFWMSITDLSARSLEERRVRQANADLERVVRARTRELRQANSQLRKQVFERRMAEGRLRQYARALEAANMDLVRANEATREAHAARLNSERLAREEAESANRMKDEFLAILSHELRTPLNAVMGWIRLIRSGKLKPQDAERALEVVERNAHTQAKMIGDLLEMSRIISGKFSLELRRVNLPKVLESVIESMRPAAAAKKLRLDTGIETSLPSILGDAGRLEQIIGNILSNAIKFTPAGGRIDVRLSRDEQGVELRVTDTGIGILPEQLEHVFDRFRQGEASTTRRYGGLGLGLSIAQHLVAAHGGSLRAESGGDGNGSTFVVTLPALAETNHADSTVLPGTAQEERVGTPVEQQAAELRHFRILVVDDDEDTVLFMVRALELSGAIVRCARSAAEALGAFEDFSPHILISDIAMPEHDGYDLLKEVREIAAAKGRFTPALALTAFAKASDREQALSSGFQAYLSKPVDPALLTQAIADLIRSCSPREDLQHA